VSSRRYATSYLKWVTERLQDSKDSSARAQYSIERGSVQNEYRTSREQRITEEDRCWNTVDTQNTSQRGITKKNPGAKTQDREDKVFSLCGVRLCNK
jgi:hypothetical protein